VTAERNNAPVRVVEQRDDPALGTDTTLLQRLLRDVESRRQLCDGGALETAGGDELRVVVLEDASADGIKATYRDGVLEVTVAKKPEAKPTKIKINVEN